MNRTELFLKAADKLRADFEESRVVEHAGVKGGEAEKLVRDFLNSHLPGRFRAGSGFIVDRKDAVSRQTDVIIYDALNCPVYRVSDHGSVYPSDNVAAVVEVKSTMSKAELEDAWMKIAAVKALHKTPEPQTGPLVTTNTLGLVFGFDCATSVEALAGNYELLFRRDKHFGRHVDAILILDEVVMSLAALPPGFEYWQPATIEGPDLTGGEGTHIAVSTIKGERHSLDLLFRILLGHLVFFRHRIDHPGFRIPAVSHQALRYLTSVTHETDPTRKKERLGLYKKQVEEDFERRARELDD